MRGAAQDPREGRLEILEGPRLKILERLEGRLEIRASPVKAQAASPPSKPKEPVSSFDIEEVGKAINVEDPAERPELRPRQQSMVGLVAAGGAPHSGQMSMAKGSKKADKESPWL